MLEFLYQPTATVPCCFCPSVGNQGTWFSKKYARSPELEVFYFASLPPRFPGREKPEHFFQEQLGGTKSSNKRGRGKKANVFWSIPAPFKGSQMVRGELSNPVGFKHHALEGCRVQVCKLLYHITYCKFIFKLSCFTATSALRGTWDRCEIWRRTKFGGFWKP